MRPLRWWAESAPSDGDRVKVSENLEVAPVAPVDTSLLGVITPQAPCPLLPSQRLEQNPKISLEMEKLNRIYDPLLPLVDVIFVSKEYALSKNFKNKV